MPFCPKCGDIVKSKCSKCNINAVSADGEVDSGWDSEANSRNWENVPTCFKTGSDEGIEDKMRRLGGFTKPSGPVCYICTNEILGKSVSVPQFGGNVHINCFRCFKCSKMLIHPDGSSTPIVNRHDKPWCKECAKANPLSKPISASTETVETIHQEKKKIVSPISNNHVAPSLSKKKIVSENGFTKEDIKKITNKVAEGKEFCSECSEVIMGQGVDHAGRLFHASCFKCLQCKLVIDSSKGFVPDKNTGRGYHPECYRLMKKNCEKDVSLGKDKGAVNDCDICNKPLTGMLVRAGEKRYHKSCFKCYECEILLSGGYCERDGKPHCSLCGAKKVNVTSSRTIDPDLETSSTRRAIGGLRLNPRTGKIIAKIDPEPNFNGYSKGDRPALPGKRHVICTCGVLSPPGSKFCTGCGDAIGAAIVYDERQICKGCKEPRSEGRFCTNCGQRYG